jgi:hypothetical protein
MSARPDQICKKQNKQESASRFELFEKARQKVSEHKDFEPVRQSGDKEPKRPEAGMRLRWRGPQERNDNGCEPGKTKQGQRFDY